MNKFLYLLLILSLAFISFAIGWISHPAPKPPVKTPKKVSYLQKIKQRGVLNVVLLNAPSTYLIGPEGAQGFEYDLLQSYADHLGVELNVTAAHTVKEALELSKRSDIDITSASLAKPLNVKKCIILDHLILRCKSR